MNTEEVSRTGQQTHQCRCIGVDLGDGHRTDSRCTQQAPMDSPMCESCEARGHLEDPSLTFVPLGEER